MKKLIVLLIIANLSLFGLIFIVPRPLDPLPLSFPYKPGDSSIPNASCNYTYYNLYTYCSITDAMFTLDSDHKIKTISYWTMGKFSAGDLLLHQDRPIGYHRISSHIWCIYWLDHSAWILGKNSSPEDSVAFIEYGDQDTNFEAWQGFKN